MHNSTAALHAAAKAVDTIWCARSQLQLTAEQAQRRDRLALTGLDSQHITATPALLKSKQGRAFCRALAAAKGETAPQFRITGRVKVWSTLPDAGRSDPFLRLVLRIALLWPQIIAASTTNSDELGKHRLRLSLSNSDTKWLL